MNKSVNSKVSMNLGSLSSERGFNLIEVLVAMLLISMALFAVCSVLVFSSGTMHAVKKETAVTQSLSALQQLLSSQGDVMSLLARGGKSSEADPANFSVRNSTCTSDIRFAGSAAASNAGRDGLESSLAAWFNNIQAANPDAKIAFSVKVTPTEMRSINGNAFPLGDGSGKVWGPLAVDVIVVESINGSCPQFSSDTASDDELDKISDAVRTEALEGSKGSDAGVDYQKSRIMIDYIEAV